MLITLSVYTAILALILWAMQWGGVLPPPAKCACLGGQSAAHRIRPACS